MMTSIPSKKTRLEDAIATSARNACYITCDALTPNAWLTVCIFNDPGITSEDSLSTGSNPLHF